MNRSMCSFIWSSTLVVALGCGQSPTSIATKSPGLTPKTILPGQIKALKLGMTTNEIIEAFGQPSHVQVFDSIESIWRYALSPFPAVGKMEGTSVVGLVLAVTNAHLSYWGYDYVGTPSAAKTLALQQSDTGLFSAKGNAAATLNFFVVTSKALDNGRLIDLPQFPKLGYIAASPDLEIRKLESFSCEEHAGIGPTSMPSFWSFNVRLAADDTAALRALTQTNISQQVLILVGDVPVSAPTIRAPLDSGTVTIECPNKELMQLTSNSLARMLPK